MNDIKTAILDSAEHRIQAGGFGGFSFREVAADVGVKSSTVHYHFPTKENLTAAVVRRWGEHMSETIDREMHKDSDPVRVWTKAFRSTAFSGERMCPCAVLGAESRDLPEEVASEVKLFYRTCQSKLIAQGLSSGRAMELLSTIIGAQLLANAMRDPHEYDRATNDLQKAGARASVRPSLRRPR